MTPREAALVLALLKVLTAELKTTQTAATEAAELRTGDRLTAVLPGGATVGTVWMSKGRKTATVTDEAGLLAWCKEHHPTEVQTIERVRPSYIGVLTKAAAEVGEGVDPATGDPLPFITVREGDPYPSVRLADGAEAMVREAWRTGALDVSRFLLALPAGDEDS